MPLPSKGEGIHAPTRQDYQAVFELNPTGALILENLTRKFCQGPELKGGIDGIRISDFRAGARSVIEYIVNKANVLDPNFEEPSL